MRADRQARQRLQLARFECLQGARAAQDPENVEVAQLDRTRDPLVTRKKGSFAEDRHHANGVRSVETGTRIQRLRGQRGFRRVVRSQMGFLLAVLYAEHRFRLQRGDLWRLLWDASPRRAPPSAAQRAQSRRAGLILPSR